MFRRPTFLIWIPLALGAAVLRALEHVALGQPFMGAAASDVTLIAIWALATPAIIRSARQWPVSRANARVRVAAHGAVAGTFVAASNAVIRLPFLASHPVAWVARDWLRGVTTYGPGALAVYALIVAVAHHIYATTAPPAQEASGPGETEEPPTRLVIREWNRAHYIPLDDVEWIEASNNHVVVHTASRTYRGRERISDVEDRLDSRTFVRVHRSAIVNVARIREVQPLTRGDQAIIMRSGAVVRTSRARREQLASALTSMS